MERRQADLRHPTRRARADSILASGHRVHRRRHAGRRSAAVLRVQDRAVPGAPRRRHTTAVGECTGNVAHPAAGAEAVSGLGRAFFYAGTRALLVSNWPVETTSARTLTTDIFRRQADNPT
ncbi:MAG: CHAT domain-containing protein, partial [Rhodospirillales bacterium]|nr:CHAT domain-containing protein [Rhodospirillales bacterium]